MKASFCAPDWYQSSINFILIDLALLLPNLNDLKPFQEQYMCVSEINIAVFNPIEKNRKVYSLDQKQQ